MTLFIQQLLLLKFFKELKEKKKKRQFADLNEKRDFERTSNQEVACQRLFGEFIG
ncbi:hypothetical protein [Pseudobacteriovorax antillogorgiicola]|uniref:Uncharacterized protein n=1 Tax=Pseudobacteriovorax antillogorgiicola TaxID=1513793 RepID=A0A1Y6BTR2_9BACT|nr:hypothetical protein [Pseudobacteriovorax antillogorgiicola]TCS54589.1 hypothetical protein EDD56_106102 [Pseudobacteriovorax antillogorgiicola]SMF17767.1 hypothetical protein SAMN06296036_106141 [Pseudobacteriovorax antillogorgiicola]